MAWVKSSTARNMAESIVIILAVEAALALFWFIVQATVIDNPTTRDWGYLGLAIVAAVGGLWFIGRRLHTNASTPEPSSPTQPAPSQLESVVSQPQRHSTERSRPTAIRLGAGARDAHLENITGIGNIDLVDNQGAPDMEAIGVHLTGPSVGQHSDWLNGLAQRDRDEPEAAVFVDNIGILWRLNDTTGVYYFEFQVHFFNGSVYDLYAGTKVEGNLSLAGKPLLPVPEINERPQEHRDLVPHAKRSYVQLRQDLTSLRPIVDRLRDQEGQRAELNFNSLRIVSELRTEGGAVAVTFPLELQRRQGSTPNIHGDEIAFTHPRLNSHT